MDERFIETHAPVLAIHLCIEMAADDDEVELLDNVVGITICR